MIFGSPQLESLRIGVLVQFQLILIEKLPEEIVTGAFPSGRGRGVFLIRKPRLLLSVLLGRFSNRDQKNMLNSMGEIDSYTKQQVKRLLS